MTIAQEWSLAKDEEEISSIPSSMVTACDLCRLCGVVYDRA